MYIPKKQPMRENVKKEHLTSIRDKLDDLYVSKTDDMIQANSNRLVKALAVYILQGGTDASENMLKEIEDLDDDELELDDE